MTTTAGTMAVKHPFCEYVNQPEILLNNWLSKGGGSGVAGMALAIPSTSMVGLSPTKKIGVSSAACAR